MVAEQLNQVRFERIVLLVGCVLWCVVSGRGACALHVHVVEVAVTCADEP
jgi:hypothetical protein